ncbi:MAG: DUF350 domain-containing protein [bacterium]
MQIAAIVYSAAALLLSAGLLLIARVAYARLARFEVDHQLTEADNPAVGVALFGYLGGVVIVLAALLGTEGASLDDPTGMAWDLGGFVAWGLIAIVLLKLAGWLNDKLLLRGFENKKELVDDHNLGVGATLCGSYLASGLVLAGALSGTVAPEVLPADAGPLDVFLHELGTAFAFYALGQLALIAFGWIYRAIQPRDVLRAIEEDYVVDGVHHGGNAAAGIAFGGNLTALGLVLYGAAHADFTGWADNLTTFGILTAIGLVLLPLWRYVVDHVMLGKADLQKEIYEDRNTNAALLETASVIGMAMVLVFVV